MIEKVEVIEFNTNTRWRKVYEFESFEKAIGFIKSRRNSIKKGKTYTICDLTNGGIN